MAEQWYVVNHDDDNRKLRGPFATAETAAAVRREMETPGGRYDEITLWIVSEQS